MTAQADRQIDVRIRLRPFTMEGTLVLPEQARGVVLFGRGSASGPGGARDLMLAEALQRAQMATLLIDLLTADEQRIDEETHYIRFDVDLLAGRLVIASDWLGQQAETRDLGVGYFGAGTLAAAALIAASERSAVVKAVVARSGRPDLAGASLTTVRAPTLLIVAERDDLLIRRNQKALPALPFADKRLDIIPAAAHLFEDPAAAGEAVRLAREWFERFVKTVG
jgi:putative phosphoribosyl transferase